MKISKNAANEPKGHYILLQGQRRKGSLIRQLYLQMLGDQPTVQWKCLMFNDATRLKACFIMWLMLHKRVVTADRLIKWRLDVAKTCVLCHNEDVSIEHIFVQCHFSINLWNKILTWLQRQVFSPINWSMYIRWSTHQGKRLSLQAQTFKTLLE